MKSKLKLFLFYNIQVMIFLNNENAFIKFNESLESFVNKVATY